MNIAENLWLESIAARAKLVKAAHYSAAFYGNAALQSMHLGLTVPLKFWSAMARSGDSTSVDPSANAPKSAEAANVVPLMPAAAVTKPAPMPKVADTVPVAKPEAAAKGATSAPVTKTTKPAPIAKKTTAKKPVAKKPAARPVNGLIRLDAARGGKPDDLTLVRGIGAKLAQSLQGAGIYHYDQIAGLNGDGIDALDARVPGFKRSAARFDLVTGAKILA